MMVRMLIGQKVNTNEVMQLAFASLQNSQYKIPSEKYVSDEKS